MHTESSELLDRIEIAVAVPQRNRILNRNRRY